MTHFHHSENSWEEEKIEKSYESVNMEEWRRGANLIHLEELEETGKQVKNRELSSFSDQYSEFIHHKDHSNDVDEKPE